MSKRSVMKEEADRLAVKGSLATMAYKESRDGPYVTSGGPQMKKSQWAAIAAALKACETLDRTVRARKFDINKYNEAIRGCRKAGILLRRAQVK